MDNFTLLLGGLVILTGTLRFYNTNYPLSELVQLSVEPGLAWLFFLYAICIVKYKADTYSYFAYNLGLSSIVIVAISGRIFNEFNGNYLSGWHAVANHVAAPIAQSSLFVLPYLYWKIK